MTSGLDSSAKPRVPNLHLTKVRLGTVPQEIATNCTCSDASN